MPVFYAFRGLLKFRNSNQIFVVSHKAKMYSLSTTQPSNCKVAVAQMTAGGSKDDNLATCTTLVQVR